MDKISELTKLKSLLDEKAISQNEFENLKSELLRGDSTHTSTTEIMPEIKDSNGTLWVKFPGQWFLFDMKTKIFANGNLIASESTKQGFDVKVPLTSDKITLKIALGRLKSTVFELSDINQTKNYNLKLEYDNSWGKFSKESKIEETW